MQNNMQRKYHNVLIDSILNENIEGVNVCLSKGVNLNKNKALNLAIINLFRHQTNKINFLFIKNLIELGACPWNHKNDNTLSITISHGTKYIKKNLNSSNSQKIVLDLINLLILHLARPNESDTLFLAVKSKNQKIIELIFEIKLKESKNQSSLLTYAVDIENLKIVRMLLLQYNVYPCVSNCDDNTLLHAILTCNCEIIQLMIRSQKIVDNSNFFKQYIFREFYNNCVISSKFTSLILNNCLNLIMCSGLDVDSYTYRQIISKEMLTEIESKILICYEIFNKPHSNITETLELKKNKSIHKIELRNQLSATMIDLMENPQEKKNRINDIYLGLGYVPMCIVSLIFDYEYFYVPNVKYIDWKGIII